MNLKAIKTLAHKAFRNTGGLKTQASGMSFFIMASLAVSFLLVLVSYIMYWRFYQIFENEYGSILVVNEPDSFCHFMEDQGIHHTDNLHLECDAYYDFRYFGELMEEHEAGVLLVFPKDFDAMVLEGDEAPEVLTYCRTDYLRSLDIKNYVIDTYLNDYLDYIKEAKGCTVALNDPVEITLQGTPTQEETDMATGVAKFAAQSLVPLLIFVTALYASMNSGTNIIAGEKERGTFAAILLSPVSRREIIIGDLLGVSLGSFIPAAVMLFAVLLLPYYSGIAGMLATLPLLISLILLIASLTLLISVISDSVVSAQTAFLPLFFIMVTICVTCIQNAGNASELYYMIPIYGHFYGIGNLIYNVDIRTVLYSAVCFFNTMLIVAAAVFTSVKLLNNERFTVNTMTSDDHAAAPADHKLTTKTLPGFIVDQAVYPLIVLSIFQTLAMVPVFVKYTSTAAFGELVESMKAVDTFKDILQFSFDLLGLFLADPLFIICMSIGYIAIMVCYLVKVMLKENIASGKGMVKKHIASLGLELNKKTPVKYACGLVLGVALMSCVYLILNLTGQVAFKGFTITKSVVTTVLISVLMWIPQGACEELMFRGYMLPRITKKTNKIFAFILSSFLFSVLHSMNLGYTPLASINLFLIALLFALISYRSGSIWITCGAHTAWNFCQGNLYGLQVSGNELSSTLIKTSYTKGHLDIVTGGDFGPEGGLAVTAITLPLVILLIVLIRKDSKKTSRLW